MNNPADIVSQLKDLDRTVTRLGHVAALLEWDQETFMPPAAAEERASQIALIVGLHHERIVDEKWGGLFEKLGPDPVAACGGLDTIDAAFVRETHRRFRKKTRVPGKLVEDLARETSLAQTAWVKARKADDFAAFAPHLKTVIALEQEYAAAVAPEADPYDTLLDEYEPGATGAEISRIFDGLADGLGILIAKIRGGDEPDISFLERSFDIDRQNTFGKMVQSAMGYDTARGRLDLSAHPFTTTLGPDDVRVTTRYSENLPLSGLMSNIHEAGHGLYEQGIGSALRGTILADGTSLGIHESQSRFWENTVGRSLAFWERWYDELKGLFPDQLTPVGLADFHRAVNVVRPSLIRVEADEVTYSFHVIVRFRLERALISGELSVDELPQAWRDAYKEHLGITPPDDASGCMQDVHWSVGLFGYFPTYALGNLYAAQFTRTLESELGPLDGLIRAGRMGDILGWLRRNIHEHGRVYPPGELCRRVTGEALKPSYFLDYLNAKYADIYRFQN